MLTRKRIKHSKESKIDDIILRNFTAVLNEQNKQNSAENLYSKVELSHGRPKDAYVIVLAHSSQEFRIAYPDSRRRAVRLI